MENKKLLSPAEMPSISGMQIPQEFYWILQSPAPLAGMAYPAKSTPWQAIGEAGIRYIVCLTDEQPKYWSAPLLVLYAAQLEDLFDGGLPQDPEREERLIREAVEAATRSLLAGEGVVVHCAGGTGRTGTVIGCLLRRLGVPAQDVLAYLDSLNRARGKRGWPEADWQAELVRRFEAS